MPEFIAIRGGGVRLLLDDAETEIIRRLADELRTLITDGQADDVLDRLLPATYEDEAEERKYREIVSDDLTRHKIDALEAVRASLGTDESDITLTDEALALWLACLTDIRLAIGTRLDIDDERMAADIDPRDPNAHAISVLHWLGWIQEGLLQATGSV